MRTEKIYTEHLGFKIKLNQKEKLLKVCKTQASTPSQLLRKVVTEWLESQVA